MYYKQLNVSSNIISNLKKKIETTTEDQWKNTLEQELISLTIDDFSSDHAIKKLITDIGDINRLAIYRFFGKESPADFVGGAFSVDNFSVNDF